ncbi:hypothetical protein KM043_012515 [Ampulex compressa]|nr:hypothetical protein KM043_012515 [Ampulex compressa]
MSDRISTNRPIDIGGCKAKRQEGCGSSTRDRGKASQYFRGEPRDKERPFFGSARSAPRFPSSFSSSGYAPFKSRPSSRGRRLLNDASHLPLKEEHVLPLRGSCKPRDDGYTCQGQAYTVFEVPRVSAPKDTGTGPNAIIRFSKLRFSARSSGNAPRMQAIEV